MPNPCYYQDYERSMSNPAQSGSEGCLGVRGAASGGRAVPGYLAHKKPPLPRTLQQGSAQGPMVVLGVVCFLMSEVPLYIASNSMPP